MPNYTEKHWGAAFFFGFLGVIGAPIVNGKFLYDRYCDVLGLNRGIDNTGAKIMLAVVIGICSPLFWLDPYHPAKRLGKVGYDYGFKGIFGLIFDPIKEYIVESKEKSEQEKQNKLDDERYKKKRKVDAICDSLNLSLETNIDTWTIKDCDEKLVKCKNALTLARGQLISDYERFKTKINGYREKLLSIKFQLIFKMLPKLYAGEAFSGKQYANAVEICEQVIAVLDELESSAADSKNLQAYRMQLNMYLVKLYQQQGEHEAAVELINSLLGEENKGTLRVPPQNNPSNGKEEQEELITENQEYVIKRKQTQKQQLTDNEILKLYRDYSDAKILLDPEPSSRKEILEEILEKQRNDVANAKYYNTKEQAYINLEYCETNKSYFPQAVQNDIQDILITLEVGDKVTERRAKRDSDVIRSDSMETDAVVAKSEETSSSQTKQKTTFLSFIGRIIPRFGKYLKDRTTKKINHIDETINAIKTFLSDTTTATSDQLSTYIKRCLAVYEVALDLFHDGEISERKLSEIKAVGDNLMIRAHLQALNLAELHGEISTKEVVDSNLSTKVQSTYTKLTVLYTVANDSALKQQINSEKSRLEPYKAEKKPAPSEPMLAVSTKAEGDDAVADESSAKVQRVQTQLADAEHYLAIAMAAKPVKDFIGNLNAEEVLKLNLETAKIKFNAVLKNNKDLTENEIPLINIRIKVIDFVLAADEKVVLRTKIAMLNDLQKFLKLQNEFEHLINEQKGGGSVSFQKTCLKDEVHTFSIHLQASMCRDILSGVVTALSKKIDALEDKKAEVAPVSAVAGI